MRVDDDAVWSMFLADVEPGRVEVERFRMPPLEERPGSRADRRMRREHDERAHAFWVEQRYPKATRAELAAIAAAGREYDRTASAQRFRAHLAKLKGAGDE